MAGQLVSFVFTRTGRTMVLSCKYEFGADMC